MRLEHATIVYWLKTWSRELLDLPIAVDIAEFHTGPMRDHWMGFSACEFRVNTLVIPAARMAQPLVRDWGPSWAHELAHRDGLICGTREHRNEMFRLNGLLLQLALDKPEMFK